MAKVSRKYNVAACTSILLLISFWASIISSILHQIEILWIASIVYAVCIIAFEYSIYDSKDSWKKRALIFAAIEALQVVPCIIILVVHVLF